MGVQLFAFTHNRYQVVDFTFAIYEESYSVLIPFPTEESRLFTCIRPFQWKIKSTVFQF